MKLASCAFLPCLVLVAALLLPGVVRGSRAGDESSPFGENRFCGPMCLQRVLQHYGKPEDIVALIREVQWPDTSRGTSFDAMADALERRGIHARAITVESLQSFDWHSPAIIQLELRGASHFVVWLPPGAEEQARIWDGSQSRIVRDVDPDSVLSGPVLLTSDSPIATDDRVRTAHPTRPSTLQIAVSAMAGMVAGMLLAGRRLTRSHR